MKHEDRDGERLRFRPLTIGSTQAKPREASGAVEAVTGELPMQAKCWVRVTI